MNWFLLWLFLHLLAAVIAFGPIFVFPIVGTLAAQMPQHLPFALELNHRIERRLVVPLSLTMFVSGVGLIWTANINIFQSVYRWCRSASTLWRCSSVSAFSCRPPAGSRSCQQAPMVFRRDEFVVRRSQMFGGAATLLFVAIMVLMIVQPGGIVFR